MLLIMMQLQILLPLGSCQQPLKQVGQWNVTYQSYLVFGFPSTANFAIVEFLGWQIQL
jgi:hypothetical protein